MTPFTSFLHLRTLCSCKWFKTAVTDETAFSIRESLCHRAGCISNVKSSSVTSLMRAFLEPGNKSQNVSFWYALRSLLVFCFQLFLFRAALGSDGRFLVCLGDGVIADLVAAPTNTTRLLSEVEFRLTFLILFTNICIWNLFVLVV